MNGAYGYPLEEAARMAINTMTDVLEQLADDSPLVLARLVLFSADALAAFERTLVDGHQK